MHRLSVDRFDCTISAEEVQDLPQFLLESPAVQAACGAGRSQRYYGETVYFMRRIWYTQSMLEQIAAFDVGDKRVGVAFSDPFGDYAVPSDTYFRTGDFRRDIAALAAIAAARGVHTVVVGLPLNEDGSESVPQRSQPKGLPSFWRTNAIQRARRGAISSRWAYPPKRISAKNRWTPLRRRIFWRAISKKSRNKKGVRP